MSRSFSAAVVAVALSAIYLVLQLGFVRPHLWPAGEGAAIGGESGAIFFGRPPVLDDDAARFITIRPGSSADAAGIRAGDQLIEQTNLRTRDTIDLRGLAEADADVKLRAWRDVYRMGVRDPLRVTVLRPSTGEELAVTLLRPSVGRLDAATKADWLQQHLSDILQFVVFIAMAAIIVGLRAAHPTAVLAVFALTLCAVAAGGPALGSEYLLPPPLRQALTLFTWTATPLAFIATTFAVGYFPRKSPLLVGRPWLLAVPFIVTAPMLVLSLSSALFLLGIDGALPIVVWDAANPWLFFASFGLAVMLNLGVVAEGGKRFRANRDQNERRRIAIAVITIVPGVIAFSIKEGVPSLGYLIGRDFLLPWWLTLALQIVVLLPAVALAYVVAVNRVLSPKTVLRRSVQYALARKTLAVLAMLPGLALILSLVKNRDLPIGELISGRPMFYLLTTAALIAAIKYREAERRWLDRRFFREAYDAREILLSLASRITYETDPNELTALVVDRIDTALHPETIAVLVGGVEPGQLKPISVLRGTAAPLSQESGLVTMLQWSNEPLELYIADERSPARRLPPPDQEWLRASGAVLFVPVITRGPQPAVVKSELIALIALGARRSEEPYTAEDRQLLASIAAQIGLALDVARLRQRAATPVPEAPPGPAVAAGLTAADALAECPRCGRCAAPDVAFCPDDGVAMQVLATVPHVIERKYRMDRVIGRGGMGAVFCARDLRLDRDVAIKVVRADLLADAEARTRFRREAQIVARLQHPGIVAVYDYGTFNDGSAFLVMELVRGEDLRCRLRRERTLTPPQALPVLAAAGLAVEAAHREGVLHRDLKPENIVVLDRDDQPVKVLDFGVAKIVTERGGETVLPTLTGAGGVVGTPAYMAPEQLRGDAVDSRSDVFSLGVIAYEILTGDLPFGRASLWEIGERQARGMKPMAWPDGKGNPQLERAIARALSFEPDARHPSAADFVGDLAADAAFRTTP